MKVVAYPIKLYYTHVYVVEKIYEPCIILFYFRIGEHERRLKREESLKLYAIFISLL